MKLVAFDTVEEMGLWQEIAIAVAGSCNTNLHNMEDWVDVAVLAFRDRMNLSKIGLSWSETPI